MKKLVKPFLLASFLFQPFLFHSKTLAAELYLQIQRGEKVTIGLPDFSPKTDSEIAIAKEMGDAAQQDLLFTRLFNLVKEGPKLEPGKIDFEGWQKNGADILITAVISLKEENVQMVASVYEVEPKRPIFQKSYRSSPESCRLLAHEFVSDFIYRFTGDPGIAKTKIAFANNASGSKEIYLIDYDGSNLKQLTNDKSLAILPRWSPDGKEIVYTTYRQGNPDLYLYSMESGKSRSFSARKGLNSAASFSPDGTTLIATLSHEGYPNLYLLDREGKILRRLTNGSYADTSPCFSPDGHKILFVSDRPGWPQIYMMDMDGSNVKRITDSGYCDSPVWSPRGDQIAYSKGSNRGSHQIFIDDLSTGNTFQLTQNSANNENPSFSPDGRFIIYTSSRDKKRELFISSIDGAVQKEIGEIKGESFTPAWGP